MMKMVMTVANKKVLIRVCSLYLSKLQLSDMKSMLGKPGLSYLLSECAIIV